jgi:serine phosphatase RsbU (regulator of sigma subunit)
LVEIQFITQFALLESVRKSNQISCYLIDNDTFAYSDWAKVTADDFVFINPVGQASDDIPDTVTTEIMSSRQRLLLAYPLAVKGTVLGIMVTEEEFSERGAPPFNIRERRMEIVTGITQQAALAIQNDIYQRDAIHRERLDRELQLAREIQMNFMPDELPQPDGWELGVRWMPARQVGGDYYDVFELPDGKIGLVIADVADKGMPAALFMILVRTLLRATVRDNRSPAEALHDVNELLVPDAKNGMFVTLVYGVLFPATGDFVYANAGHVPPMLIRNETKDVFELFPTAMALGVLSDTDIKERQLLLHPGDCLVFYTDGVSEAFSPAGEMYGNEQLKQLLVANVISSTPQLLDSIVAAVDEFTSTAPMSDDLTLVALYRKSIL